MTAASSFQITALKESKFCSGSTPLGNISAKQPEKAHGIHHSVMPSEQKSRQDQAHQSSDQVADRGQQVTSFALLMQGQEVVDDRA